MDLFCCFQTAVVHVKAFVADAKEFSIIGSFEQDVHKWLS